MPQINIDEPRWDQSIYWGRAKHFFTITNPLNLLCTDSELENAREVITKCRKGEQLNLTEDEIWRSKHTYDSAFHPETGEKMILIGRMSFSSSYEYDYRSTPQVVFWQWVNQSFNAVVNYTNRSGDSPVPLKQLGISYVLATSGTLITALGLNNLVKTALPLINCFVPFCAVAAANCVNIPLMRLKEFQEGIPVVDKNGNKVASSKTAAKWAVTQVVLSRNIMSMPGMFLPAIVMNYLDKRGALKQFPWMSAPLQVAICGLCLVFATPLCCALFPQQSFISVDNLEPEVQELTEKLKITDKLYYNKGL